MVGIGEVVTTYQKPFGTDGMMGWLIGYGAAFGLYVNTVAGVEPADHDLADVDDTW